MTRVQTTYSDSLRVHNGHVTDADAQRLLEAAKKENYSGSSGWVCCSTDGAEGTVELKRIFRENQDRFDPSAKSVINTWLGRHSTLIQPGIIAVSPTDPEISF